MRNYVKLCQYCCFVGVYHNYHDQDTQDNHDYNYHDFSDYGYNTNYHDLDKSGLLKDLFTLSLLASSFKSLDFAGICQVKGGTCTAASSCAFYYLNVLNKHQHEFFFCNASTICCIQPQFHAITKVIIPQKRTRSRKDYYSSSHYHGYGPSHGYSQSHHQEHSQPHGHSQPEGYDHAHSVGYGHGHYRHQ